MVKAQLVHRWQFDSRFSDVAKAVSLSDALVNQQPFNIKRRVAVFKGVCAALFVDGVAKDMHVVRLLEFSTGQSL